MRLASASARRPRPGRGRRTPPAWPAGGRRSACLVVDTDRSVAVDRDAVVVPQHDQPAELQVPGQRDRLVADAFHQAAVAGDDIGAVVDQRVAEGGVQMPLGHRHADRVGQPWPSGPVVVSMPGVAEFSGWPAVLCRAGGSCSSSIVMARIAGQVQQRVEQHRAVAGRQHEAVAVRPARRGDRISGLG
jgi:hypothetical protein